MLKKLKSLFVKKKNVKFIENVLKTNYEKNCLLLYVLDPFINGIKETHQNQWQVIELAKMIGGYGYNVDVGDYDYNPDTYNKKYDLLVDILPSENRTYFKNLKDDCIKIAYMTGTNQSVCREKQLNRLSRVNEKRNGDYSLIQDGEDVSKKIEEFDAMFFIGNDYTLKSYSEFKLPSVYYIKNNGYPVEVNDNKNKNAKNFLFLGGVGQLRKGLDLLLDVFSTTCKDCNLYICSPFEKEKKFCQIYKKELYQTTNIHPVGVVDVQGDKAKEIFSKCTYLIVPSCAEGQMGSALIAMSAGVIPVLTRECGIDDGEFIPIESVGLDYLTNLIHELANKDSQWINSQVNLYKTIALSKYSKEAFLKSLKFALDNTIK
ncbi:MAG: glycosyltransferase [Butyrivibrio sp.]|nr:glycosyltransferase [Butyrivibrio sp.]